MPNSFLKNLKQKRDDRREARERRSDMQSITDRLANNLPIIEAEMEEQEIAAKEARRREIETNRKRVSLAEIAGRSAFSGADMAVYAMLPGSLDGAVARKLDTIQTISISVHEAKGQARALGHRNMIGMSRGVRTIAGTIILTVLDGHPLQKVFEMFAEAGRLGPIDGWSIDYNQTGIGEVRLTMNTPRDYGSPLYPDDPDKTRSGVYTNYDQAITDRKFQVASFYSRLAATLPPFDLLLTAVSEAAVYGNMFGGPIVSEGGGHLNVHEYSREVADSLDAGLSHHQTNKDWAKAFSMAEQDLDKNLPRYQVEIEGFIHYLRGIEFIDEGLVISVNDTTTEITLSFVAYDYKPLSRQSFLDLLNSDTNASSEDLGEDRELMNKLYTDRLENYEMYASKWTGK